jgi:hypothetical protein
LSCQTKGLIDSLLPVTDSILGVRDSIGAVIKPVYFFTRTWFSDSGKTTPATQPEGFATDATPVQMLPSPQIVDLSQDIRLKEGGAVKAGDIILKGISRSKFVIGDLDGTTPGRNIEKFFLVGVKLYQVINVKESYLTFSVQLRELTNQTRY